MYTFNSRVRYSETDEYGGLSVTGIMNYLQDCSTFQSEDIGLGVEYLKERRRAWWLSSWQIVIGRRPVLGEEIVVGTWPYDFKGMYGYRNFVIMDRQGDNLVQADSAWFFFDTEAGRPARVTEEDIRGYGTGDTKRLNMEQPPRRISVPEKYREGRPVMIEKHHIDTNHHVNNAKYVEIARELVPDGFMIRELRVEYRRAAVYKDLVYPRIGETEEGFVVSLCDKEGAPHAVVWMRGQTGRG